MCIWIIRVPCQYSDSVGLCRSPRYFSFVTNAEVMRMMLRQHLGRVATGSVALISNRTFCIDEKVPYLCHPYQQPLNTCSYRIPEMWFMEMKYWTLIWINAHLNSLFTLLMYARGLTRGLNLLAFPSLHKGCLKVNELSLFFSKFLESCNTIM